MDLEEVCREIGEDFIIDELMKLFLKSQDFIISISFKDKKIADEFLKTDFYKKYIPDCELLEVLPGDFDKHKVIKLEVINSDNVSFDFKFPKATLNGDINSNISIETIIVVGDYCLNYLRNSYGIFCVNGTAITKNKKGILLLGPVSGLGKTTLALNLCLKHQYNFIADDKVLIDKEGRLLGGTKTINYNKESLNKTVSKDLNNLDTSISQDILNVEKEDVPISLIIQPLIVSKGELSVFKWNYSQTKFNLYEALTKKIRGTSLRIGKQDLPVDSIDTQELGLNRSVTSNKLTEKIDAYTLTGDLENVMLKIEELLQLAE